MLNRKFLPIVGSVISLSTVLPMCSSYSQFMNYKYLVFNLEDEKQLERYSALAVFGGYRYPVNDIDYFYKSPTDNKFIYAENALCEVGYSIEYEKDDIEPEKNDKECTIVGIRCLLNQRTVTSFTQLNFAIFLLPFRLNNKLEKLRIEGKSISSKEHRTEGDPCFDHNSTSCLQDAGFSSTSNGDWEITREKADEYLLRLSRGNPKFELT